MKIKQNVFSDLGFDFEEAENLRIRADLMLEHLRNPQPRLTPTSYSSQALPPPTTTC
jgi:hypothetical protein